MDKRHKGGEFRMASTNTEPELLKGRKCLKIGIKEILRWNTVSVSV